LERGGRPLSGNGRLAGKVVLITGTAGGQGRAAALLFAREGARIVGCDLQAEGADETMELVRSAGGEMISQAPVDLGDAASVERWIASAVDAYGPFDVLYNNASAPRMAPIGELSADDWAFTMRNELDIVYHACHLAWPHFVAQGRGCIINTASAMALVARGNQYAAHVAAKGGVISLTRQLAYEGGPHRIRVNAISPGLVETPITERWLRDPKKRAERLAWYPIGRLGTPDDVAYCALYLASDESAWMTGSNIVIDGGTSIV
jgi:meso-butanediol dehydrogenase/(S,S)-butanediol dehydrogenase/diacetyl reductase